MGPRGRMLASAALLTVFAVPAAWGVWEWAADARSRPAVAVPPGPTGPAPTASTGAATSPSPPAAPTAPSTPNTMPAPGQSPAVPADLAARRAGDEWLGLAEWQRASTIPLAVKAWEDYLNAQQTWNATIPPLRDELFGLGTEPQGPVFPDDPIATTAGVGGLWIDETTGGRGRAVVAQAFYIDHQGVVHVLWWPILLSEPALAAVDVEVYGAGSGIDVSLAEFSTTDAVIEELERRAWQWILTQPVRTPGAQQ